VHKDKNISQPAGDIHHEGDHGDPRFARFTQFCHNPSETESPIADSECAFDSVADTRFLTNSDGSNP